MAFYIKPPKGNIGLNKLWDFVRKRLFFLNFMKGKSIEEISLGLQQEMYAICAECLIEGSLKDRISHFILRLLCSAYPDMQTFFIQSETELFIYRLEFYNLSDIKKILLDSLKKSLKIYKQPFITKAYKNILKTLIIVSEDINSDFEKEYIKVPFTAALDFVEKRLYPINYGYIEVPFHSIKQLCAVIFKETLLQGLNQMIASNCTQLKDPRVDYMLQDIKQWFKAKLKIPIMLISNTFILEKNLDNESENFPLCMLSLHHLLCRNHRLPHASRVQYILYLKEIGVPCDEVIKLFMKEYSIPLLIKQKNNFITCNHSWAEDKKRYIYSIEHLFGKRGSRTNYKAHSCCALCINAS